MSEVASKKSRPLIKTILIVAVLGFGGMHYFSGVANTAESVPEATEMVAPPAPEVDVAKLELETVRFWSHFSGRLVPVDMAEIKPLIGGAIQKVYFDDGQLVKKNDLLFLIDPRPHQAKVKRVEAQLASAKSHAKLAKDELARTKKLVEKKLISDSVFDAANNEYAVAIAAIEEVNSILREARLKLNYAYIKAPFDGRMSHAAITVGNVIESEMNAPVLATLIADKQLYAEFDVDEKTYIRSLRSTLNVGDMPVEMTLAMDESVVYRGHVHSFDNQLDISSGTIRTRAIFDNTDGVLTPGMYVDIRLGAAAETDVLLIDQRAIGTNQNKKFVYVIDDKQMVVYREVTLGKQHDRHRVVLSGLVQGEHVVVNGLSHIRPNMIVTAKRESVDAELVN